MNKKPIFSLLELYSPIRATMQKHLSFNRIKQFVAYSGFDMTKIAHLSQKKTDGSFDTIGDLLSWIDYGYGEMSNDKKEIFVKNLAEEICNYSPGIAMDFEKYLNRLGWQYTHGRLIPFEILEPYDFKSMPESSHPDIIQAAERFRDGKLSGAITAACGAIESACEEIYKLKNLGNITKEKSFQDKVINAIKANKKLDKLKEDLIFLGWDTKDADKVYKNITKSLNHISFVMQTLRSRMGDVHGSKDSLKPVVYDSIKWAMIITSLLI